MKIFKDPELKEEIEVIHFGKVPAGSSKDIKVYLFNDSKAIFTNLEFYFPDVEAENIEVVSAPVTIQRGKSEVLVLRWSPTLKFEKGLRTTIKIKGEKVYLG